MITNSWVKTFLILLFLGCSFQYVLMIPTCSAEQIAEEKGIQFAKQFPEQDQFLHKQSYINTYLDSLSDEVIFDLPYISQYTYSDLKGKQLKLGLDLQGGMQVTLGFDIEAMMVNLSSNADDLVFKKVLDRTRYETKLTPEKFISTFFKHYAELAKEKEIIYQFSRHPLLKDKLKTTLSIHQLSNLINHLSKEIMQDTKFLLEQRLNSLGLAQTQISLDKEQQRIYVEVPGVKNSKRIKELILTTASLEFWNTYRISDSNILEGFVKADELLRDEI